ncbi:hypothetical protein MPLB_1820037 [Mesorhizobium sp. ORS 3324]|nr:hypothetical protein MPLB_1820037 [Mesorhizobium sp. ORS 3324]
MTIIDYAHLIIGVLYILLAFWH